VTIRVINASWSRDTGSPQKRMGLALSG